MSTPSNGQEKNYKLRNNNEVFLNGVLGANERSLVEHGGTTMDNLPHGLDH
jgi:hypothetical protein